MKTLAIVNQKGGVGKSTLAVHLAYAAIEYGMKVLLVDFDKQGSLSLSFLSTKNITNLVMMSSSLFSFNPINLLPEIISKQLEIIKADDALSLLSNNLVNIEKRPSIHLKNLSNKFDLCLIDTPGSIGFNPPLTISALIAADAVICPFSIGLYESKSLSDLWIYIKNIRTSSYNPRLRLIGLLPSKINSKSREEKKALNDLRDRFGSVILKNILTERSAVKKSIIKRCPVWKCTKGSSHLAAAREWKIVCSDILENLDLKL